MWDLGILLVGLAILWIGTELTMEGAMALVERFRLSQGFVGVSVLAVGTGLPELLVVASDEVSPLQCVPASGVVARNATGSAIAQGALVLGVVGLVSRLRLEPRMAWRDGVTLLFAVALLALLTADGGVDRLEGGALLLAYALYYARLVRTERGRARWRSGAGSHACGGAVGLRIAAGLAAVVPLLGVGCTAAVIGFAQRAVLGTGLALLAAGVLLYALRRALRR